MAFSDFFVDSPEADENLENMSTKFTNMLNNENLPVYSHRNIIMRDFSDSCIDHIMDIEQKVTENILEHSE